MKDQKHWFTISTIIYFVAYALPALGDGSSDSMFGIQCAFFAFYYMFFVPLVFLGNLSNLMVFTIFILKFRKSTGPQQWPLIVKILLIGLMLISVGIWLPFMGQNDLNIGYYTWALACLGIISSYLLVPRQVIEQDPDILDHLID